ncbi:MAG: ADOP family duplicated permease [Acidobacteriota bacterium]
MNGSFHAMVREMIPAMLALRVFRKHRGLTVAAVFSLSIAMALGILSLSVSNTVLLLPPAAPEPDRLVMIHEHSGDKDIDQISYPDYQYYRQNNRVFTDIAAAPNSISLLVDSNFGGQEARAMARPVSWNYFAVMGIRPYLGRFFSPGNDESGPPTAVMTYLCWKRLGADPRVVGRRFGDYTIIGVTPQSFTGSFYGLNGDLLTPLSKPGDDASWLRKRDARSLFLIARLKPGVSQRQAQTEMAGLSGQLAKAYPKENKDRIAITGRATLLPPDAIAAAELGAGILMALVLLVMLIACANVASLLLALEVGRRQEAAIKLALGARRGRLIREFLRESSVLCLVSGALGYGIAAWVIARFSNFSIEFPMFGAYSFGLNLRLDATVLALTLGLVLMASLATGLAPALYASSPDIAQILSGESVVGGTGKAARRNALAVAQIAICTLVLIGLGLCQRNIYNLRHTDMGFSARNLVAMTTYLKDEGHSDANGKELYGAMRKAVAALPGVESVTLALDLPLFGESEIPVQPPAGGKKVSVAHTVVDAAYFSTLGIPVLQGRVFDSGDREAGMQAIVINRKMAETFWPGRNAVGQAVLAGEPASQFTVVGVVADGKYDDLYGPRRPFLYYALSQHYQPGISVIARTAGDPRLWVKPLERAIHNLGFRAPVRAVTFERWLNLTLLAERITAGVVAALGGLGLLLAVMGLSGAVSWSVSQRKKELGIRVALGARPGQLVNMILRQILPVAGTGIAIGALLGVGATILLRSQFYGIGLLEWMVLVPVSAAMLSVSLGVAYLSARPWRRIDPMEAVRHN